MSTFLLAHDWRRAWFHQEHLNSIHCWCRPFIFSFSKRMVTLHRDYDGTPLMPPEDLIREHLRWAMRLSLEFKDWEEDE